VIQNATISSFLFFSFFLIFLTCSACVSAPTDCPPEEAEQEVGLCHHSLHRVTARQDNQHGQVTDREAVALFAVCLFV
jgi:hypothetical protein